MNKKRIIFSIYDDLKNPYYGGGGALATYQIARELGQKYDVKVISGKYPGARDETVDGVKFQRAGASFWLPQLDQALYQLSLPYLVGREKYDLWFECFTPPFSTNFLPMFNKSKVIGVAHMLSGSEMGRKYKLPFYLAENFGLRFYKNIVAVSAVTKQKIEKISPGTRVEVIPNGIEKIYPRKDGRYILFIGRIEVGQKGLDLLIKAFAKASPKMGLPLWIAGSGDKFQEMALKKLVQSSKLGQKIKLVGRVSGQEKIDIFQNAQIVVAPSRFETFSVVALEALSFGKPLVVFDIDGFSWIDDSLALKVEPFNVTSLARAITKLAKDKKLRARMGERGQQFAKKWTWKKVAKRYDEYVEEILKESNENN